MQTWRFLARRNQDGSYTIGVKARDLVDVGWVDFYDDGTGNGYQRKETLRDRRGKEIEEYLARCVAEGVEPRLFQMTANVRRREGVAEFSFEPIDENGEVGFVEVRSDADRWLAMIDGGTRLLGIERAVASSVIGADATFDVRLFSGLSVPEEIAVFLLINEKQKRVRTDLGVRVVQRLLDEEKLDDQQLRTLQTVVPETDKWRYEASRIAARMNADDDSTWHSLIQMPGDSITKPIKLQAYWTSLQPLLDNADINTRLRQMQSAGTLPGGNRTDFLVLLLKNFWRAAADANPDARAEPRTNVLWGSIGVNGCHRALARISATVLGNESTPDFRRERFDEMLKTSSVADFDYWFSKPGTLRNDYPGDKGEATTMTGGSGYSRLAEILEQEWRSALHQAGASRKVLI